jgi:hypothetical protein
MSTLCSLPLENRLAPTTSKNRRPSKADYHDVGALLALGHAKRPVLQAIRAKCIDCCCGQLAEVRLCTAKTCPLWPYRMATNPFARGRGRAENFSQSLEDFSEGTAS